MTECILSSVSQSDTFFKHWNICKQCLVKSYCKNDKCINIDHLYVTRVDLKNLEKFLHTDSNQCKIWLGKFTNKRPFYSTTDLRNHVYSMSSPILKGYRVAIDCNNYKCLNLDHMYLTTKIENITSYKIKINLDKAKEIRSLWAAGESPEYLSNKYSITKQAISLILNNRSWFDPDYTPKSRNYKWQKNL